MPGDATSAPATMTPEDKTELEKLRKDNAQMGYRLRQYETQTTHPAAAAAPRSATGGHPLSSFLGDGDYNPVDQYYQALIQQQGYLTGPQWQERETALRAEVANQMQFALANIHHFRMLDKTLGDKAYAKFADPASAESKKLAEVLQSNRTTDGRPWGQPAHAKATSWDEWQFADPTIFRQAADIAEAKLFRESQAAAGTTQQATATQQAADLGNTPAGTVAGSAAPGRPDFAGMKTDEDVLDALDQSLPPGPT